MGGASTKHLRRFAGEGSGAIISENLLEAAEILARNEDFRNIFVCYLLKTSWIQEFCMNNPNMFVFGEINEMSYILPSDNVSEADEDAVRITFDDEWVRDLSSRSASADTECLDNGYSAKLAAAFADKNDIMPLIIASAFPVFLKSIEFHDWLGEQRKSTVFEKLLLRSNLKEKMTKKTTTKRSPSRRALDEEETSIHNWINTEDVHYIAKRTVRKHSSHQNRPDCQRLKNLLQKALESVSLLRLEESLQAMRNTPMSHDASWLSHLQHFLDRCPAAVSICSAHAHPVTRESFPIVYVNQAFEEMTQYSLEEVVGLNTRFLQSEATVEMSQVQKMRTAMQEMRPIKLVMTNVKKDGNPFCNLMALKPVVNAANDYAYVIGIHYEVSGYDYQRFVLEFSSYSRRGSLRASSTDSYDNVITSHSSSSPNFMPTRTVSTYSNTSSTFANEISNFVRDFQVIEDLLNLLPSALY